ncbi:MAG: VirB4 family type IV secretion system protein [Pseudobdellovibrionaceae bacterium]
MKLRPFRTFSEFSEEHSLAKQLPYWEFIENIVVLSDGSLCLPFQLAGLAIETWDAERVNRLCQDLRATLNGLADGLEITFAVQMNSDFSALIDEHEKCKGDESHIRWVAEARIEALREQVKTEQLLKPTLYLFVYERFQRNSPGKSGGFLASLLRPPKDFEQIRKDQFEKGRLSLMQSAHALCESLQALGIEWRSLEGKETQDLIYRFLNPTRSKDVSAPSLSDVHKTQEFLPNELKIAPELVHQSPREQLVFSDVIQGYETFFYDGYYHRCITLKSLPENTYAAMMSRMSALPFHYWLDVHVKVPEQSKELADLQTKRRMAHSMSVSHGGRATDLESEAQLQSTEELLRELINTGQKIFYFQVALMLRSKSQDDLEMMSKTALNKFRELSGAEGLSENVAGFKVFKTILPAGCTTSVRPKRVKTDNLADFLPIYEPYSGKTMRPVCLFHNRQGGLVRYDPFDAKNLPNFSSLVTGSSGAGKSFLNNLILCQYMTQKPMTYVIDIGGSYKKLCEFMNGQYIEIAPPKEGEARKAINPFQLEEGEKKPSSQKVKFLLALLESMFTDTDEEKLPKLSKSLLEEAIVTTYKNVLDTKGRTPRLSDLREVLEKSPEKDLQNFSKMLYPWTGDRAYGRLLDQDNELDLNSDFVVFDLKSLSNYPDLQSVMTLIITDFIIGKVESRNPLYFGRRKRILMDECWELLKSKAAANAMEYWVRTLRKSGSGVTFITQGVAEIAAHPISSAILGNTATKLILLQKGDLTQVRDILKLNDQEIALISSLKQKKGVYSEAFMIANEDRTIIRAMPTPLEYWLATSDRDDNTALENIRAENPEMSLNQAIYEMAIKYPRGVSNGTAKAG